MAALRIIIGYVLAVATTAIAGTVLQTHQVIAALTAAGAVFTHEQRMQMTHGDLLSFGPQFAAIVAIALGVGFLAAALLKRVLTPLAAVAYPLAGALSIAAALIVLPIVLKLDGIIPLAGSRGVLGFALQALAGAAGGLVFALIAAKK